MSEKTAVAPRRAVTGDSIQFEFEGTERWGIVYNVIESAKMTYYQVLVQRGAPSLFRPTDIPRPQVTAVVRLRNETDHDGIRTNYSLRGI